MQSGYLLRAISFVTSMDVALPALGQIDTDAVIPGQSLTEVGPFSKAVWRLG
jgi:hypothetical protein